MVHAAAHRILRSEVIAVRTCFPQCDCQEELLPDLKTRAGASWSMRAPAPAGVEIRRYKLKGEKEGQRDIPVRVRTGDLSHVKRT